LLKTLIARRWLTYSPATKTYALGSAVIALAQRAGNEARLSAVAQPILARLTEATGETSALNLLNDGQTVVAATALSSQRLLSVMRAGDRAPLYATSGGKAILASFQPAALSAYLESVRFEAFTAATITSPDRLHEELERVRLEGFAMSLEEFTPGVIGIACPLPDGLGKAYASVNVAMPASRHTPQRRQDTVGHIRSALVEFQAKLDQTVTG
jgi:DNA-binding IclR family transcriptional regulator